MSTVNNNLITPNVYIPTQTGGNKHSCPVALKKLSEKSFKLIQDIVLYSHALQAFLEERKKRYEASMRNLTAEISRGQRDGIATGVSLKTIFQGHESWFDFNNREFVVGENNKHVASSISVKIREKKTYEKFNESLVKAYKKFINDETDRKLDIQKNFNDLSMTKKGSVLIDQARELDKEIIACRDSFIWQLACEEFIRCQMIEIREETKKKYEEVEKLNGNLIKYFGIQSLNSEKATEFAQSSNELVQLQGYLERLATLKNELLIYSKGFIKAQDEFKTIGPLVKSIDSQVIQEKLNKINQENAQAYYRSKENEITALIEAGQTIQKNVENRKATMKKSIEQIEQSFKPQEALFNSTVDIGSQNLLKQELCDIERRESWIKKRVEELKAAKEELFKFAAFPNEYEIKGEIKSGETKPDIVLNNLAYLHQIFQNVVQIKEKIQSDSYAFSFSFSKWRGSIEYERKEFGPQICGFHAKLLGEEKSPSSLRSRIKNIYETSYPSFEELEHRRERNLDRLNATTVRWPEVKQPVTDIKRLLEEGKKWFEETEKKVNEKLKTLDKEIEQLLQSLEKKKTYSQASQSNSVGVVSNHAEA